MLPLGVVLGAVDAEVEVPLVDSEFGDDIGAISVGLGTLRLKLFKLLSTDVVFVLFSALRRSNGVAMACFC